MIENIYTLLEGFGFGHPLHPMLTHIPMGMIIAMVLFSALGTLGKNNNFNQTAFHCSVLALVGILPVIIAGVLDWLHFLEGEWSIFISVKMVLGGLLTVLLLISVILKRNGSSPAKMMLIYFLCLACAGGLGYSGGELVYG